MEQTSFDWGRSIQQAFEEYDRAHPEVYEYLVRLAYEAHGRGFRHYGIGALWERMRWHFQIEQDMSDEFKLNNNYRSRYARKIIAAHPELEDFFELRCLRSTDARNKQLFWQHTFCQSLMVLLRDRNSLVDEAVGMASDCADQAVDIFTRRFSKGDPHGASAI